MHQGEPSRGNGRRTVTAMILALVLIAAGAGCFYFAWWLISSM